MQFLETPLKDAWLIHPTKRGDERGVFARTYCRREFGEKGVKVDWVQQNMSVSTLRGTLRGMHFQRGAHAEDKLIRCVRGALLDVLVDLRPQSPTYRRWAAFELSEANSHLVFAPKGVAHGFQTLRDDTEITYLVSASYEPASEGGVRWDDPAFGIDWPLPPTVMSEKDKSWPDFQG